MTVPPLGQFLSTFAASQRAGVCRNTIIMAAESGEIPFLKIGHSRGFRKEDVDDWAADREAEHES